MWRRYLPIRPETLPALRFLDVGCGGGIATEALARLGYNITGVDLSAPSVEAAALHAKAEGVLNVRYVVGSAYDLPFESASFDGVVSSDVLEHIHDLPKMIKEVQRVLKANGVFVFDTINRSWLSYLITIIGAQDLLALLPRNTHDWRLYLTPNEATSLMEANGFVVNATDFSVMRPSLNPTQIFKGIIPGFLGGFIETDDLSANYLGTAVLRRSANRA